VRLRWQSVLSRQVGKQLCLSVEVWAHRHDERFGAFFPRLVERYV